MISAFTVWFHHIFNPKSLQASPLSDRYALKPRRYRGCWDNAVVERFFGSLKHDWLFKKSHANRMDMRQDVLDYLRYYNLTRLHTVNNYLSPVAHENAFRKIS